MTDIRQSLTNLLDKAVPLPRSCVVIKHTQNVLELIEKLGYNIAGMELKNSVFGNGFVHGRVEVEIDLGLGSAVLRKNISITLLPEDVEKVIYE